MELRINSGSLTPSLKSILSISFSVLLQLYPCQFRCYIQLSIEALDIDCVSTLYISE